MVIRLVYGFVHYSTIIWRGTNQKEERNQSQESLVMSDYGGGAATAPLLLGIDPSYSDWHEQTKWKCQLSTN